MNEAGDEAGSALVDSPQFKLADHDHPAIEV
jgi:hypothetical protein